MSAAEAAAIEASTSRSWATVEVSAFAGYRFGGTASPQGNTYIDRVGIPSALSFGASVEVPISDAWHVEALWDHQSTELKVDFSGTALAGTNPDRVISNLTIDTIQAGILVQSGSSDERARLFADLLLGATILTPSAPYSGLTRFSLSIGAGAKYWLTDHLAGRFAIRWMPVYINSTSAGYSYCDPIYGCYPYWNNSYLSQGDASLGVIYKF